MRHLPLADGEVCGYLRRNEIIECMAVIGELCSELIIMFGCELMYDYVSCANNKVSTPTVFYSTATLCFVYCGSCTTLIHMTQRELTSFLILRRLAAGAVQQRRRSLDPLANAQRHCSRRQ